MHDHDSSHEHGHPYPFHGLFDRFSSFASREDAAEWRCAGRGHHEGPPGGRGGHGFRHFGFGGGPGGFGFRAGRKLSSTDLQLLLLHLVGEKPRHGYELIKAIEELSNGFYVPSPGVIYPALTYLEEAGEAASRIDGARKLYQPTDAGKARLEERAADVEDLLEQLAQIGRGMDRVREALADDGGAEEGEEGGFGARDWRLHRADARELRGAFRMLRAALREKRGAPLGELVRVAEILRRAAEEILGDHR